MFPRVVELFNVTNEELEAFVKESSEQMKSLIDKQQIVQQNAINLLEKQIKNTSHSLLNAVSSNKPMDEQMNLRRKLDALNWLLNLATAAGGC